MNKYVTLKQGISHKKMGSQIGGIMFMCQRLYTCGQLDMYLSIKMTIFTI